MFVCSLVNSEMIFFHLFEQMVRDHCCNWDSLSVARGALFTGGCVTLIVTTTPLYEHTIYSKLVYITSTLRLCSQGKRGEQGVAEEWGRWWWQLSGDQWARTKCSSLNWSLGSASPSFLSPASSQFAAIVNLNARTVQSASAFLADLVRDSEPLASDNATSNASQAIPVPAACELESAACVLCVQKARRRRLKRERGRERERDGGRGAQQPAMTHPVPEATDNYIEHLVGDDDVEDYEEDDTESEAGDLEPDWDDASRPVTCTLVPPPLHPPASPNPGTSGKHKLSLPREHTAFDAVVLLAVLTSTNASSDSNSSASAHARRLQLQYRVDLSSALSLLRDRERSECLRPNAADARAHLVLQLTPFTCHASSTEPQHCEVQCSYFYTRIILFFSSISTYTIYGYTPVFECE